MKNYKRDQRNACLWCCRRNAKLRSLLLSDAEADAETEAEAEAEAEAATRKITARRARCAGRLISGENQSTEAGFSCTTGARRNSEKLEL